MEYKQKDVAGDGHKNVVSATYENWHSHLLVSDTGTSLLHVSNAEQSIISALFKSILLNMSMVSSSKIVHKFLPSYPSFVSLLTPSKPQTMLHSRSPPVLKIS